MRQGFKLFYDIFPVLTIEIVLVHSSYPKIGGNISRDGSVFL